MFRKGYSLHKIPVYLLVFFLVVFQNNLINAQCNAINFTTSITSDYNGAAVSCPNACDGEITVNVTSAGGPFGYTLVEQSTGNTIIQSSPIFSNLCGSGNYTVTVTDFNGCQAQDTIEVFQPNILLANLTQSPENCGQLDGSITASPTGGTPGYSYFWIGNDTLSQTTQTITNLAYGNYSVWVC